MSYPAIYRKRPVEIEAMRLEPGTDNWKDACDWINSAVVRGESPDADAGGPYMRDGSVFIPTLEGVMEASPGDWIIRGVQGEFYPCKDEIFWQTYESVQEEVPVPELLDGEAP